MGKLTGKTAFVTGGSRGIGAAIVKRLAEEGAHVIFTHSGRSPHKADEVVAAARINGNRVKAVQADSARTEELLRALQLTVDDFGGLDILVSNAGVATLKPITEFTLEEYDHTMDVNVKAVFIASRFAAEKMNAGGRIITIGSNMADRPGAAGATVYGMSKSALSGLTKALSHDLGPRNIAAVLIQPGPVNTDMNPVDSEWAPALISETTLGRYGNVNEIAGLVAYLSGDESQYITGSTITIDGGFNV